ncbi:HTH-type transcriptional regulator HdfR [Pragia fontium]|uniref:HTH-type transcriptional regulator HdfR n=2 Tax=Pragia fontium TaxID=82985 RepID=A0AAJ4WD62_9GAMM|nr:HTH-type transcriptional regulator HdfR [Pragia fontium]SFD33727.1 DNA-binding transcriptional regulator, LysR family [Pragia fontium DSM 5563 = ATCC 49100]SUB84183.1 HTH-type transcriptional regulator gltC [Pragia fontium]VEJ57076.1 HTH-type transcriptional regulator gltC [Pragia fontium]
MDTELLKTFLEVSKTRHFGRAAESLYLTQSAVSSRIRLLESQLGVNLFTRHRNNIRLTSAGEQLLPYAENMIATWHQARNSIVKNSQKKNMLSIGALSLIWESYLTDWLELLYSQHKNLQFDTRIATRNLLVQQLHERQLDLLIATEPSKMDELISQQIGVIPLRLFTAERKINDKKRTYISLDWGVEFVQQEKTIISQESIISLTGSSALMAKQLLKNTDGCAFLPESWKKQYPDLKLIPSSPTIDIPVYAIWLQNSEYEQLIHKYLATSATEKE